MKRISQLCEEWQEILGLKDWDVKILIVSKEDMSKPNIQGSCTYTLSTKTALISILNPINYDPSCPWKQDLEQTLVHELLHLHFSFVSRLIEDGSLEQIIEDQVVSALSKALVSLKRQN